jgi:1,4-dihydroxy-2-naphthoate octaprenyltransferase
VPRGFLLVSLAPTSLGLALAGRDGATIDLLPALGVVLAVWTLHAGGNLLNEACDYRSGADRVNRVVTPFSGGTRVLVVGALAERAVRRVAHGLLAIGLAAFTFLAWRLTPWLFLFGLVGYVSAILYSGEKFRLAYRGWGELVLGLTFGPALVGTGYFAAAGTITPGAVALGIAIGALAAAVLVINEFPDVAADAEVGKLNRVVRWGPRGGLALYVALIVIGTGVPVAAALFGVLPRTVLATGFPLAAAAWIAARGARNVETLAENVASCRRTIQLFVVGWLVMLVAIGVGR